MTDELKDYSRLYSEEKPIRLEQQVVHRENRINNSSKVIDFKELVQKLTVLEQVDDASNELSKHYTSFIKKKKTQVRVLIKYPSSENVYAVRIGSDSLTLGSVKEKLPKVGNYRYFFKTKECFEEIESNESQVPMYNENLIQLHLFERNRK